MAYGLTSTGFTTKRLQTIRSEINTAFQGVFGDVDTGDDSVLGQIAGVLAEPLAELWELMELIYASQSPASADGVQLDNVAGYLGIERLGATATRVDTMLYTDTPLSAPFTIPLGTQFSMSTTGSAFQLSAPTTIDLASVVDCNLQVTDCTSGATVTATLAGIAYTATAGGGDTSMSLASTLAGLIAADYATQDWSSGSFRVISTDYQSEFSVAVSSSPSGFIQIDRIGTLGESECTTDGTFACPANTLDTIDTPASGLDDVGNLVAGETGRGTETDAELRLRRSTSLQIASAGTLAAIRSRIADDVDDVASCTVYENVTDSTDSDGLPPHSLLAVVSGGDATDIGNMIWDTKPAGIRTYGDTTVSITDTNGDPQSVYFARPLSKYVWVDTTYNVYSEENYPGFTTAEAAIKASIKTFGDTFVIGQDIIRDRYYGPIYSAGVEGIGSIASLKVALMDDATSVPSGGDWTTGDISVLVTWLGTHDEDHVLVTEA
jgi:uncharacterized phage protein gp47/JayE